MAYAEAIAHGLPVVGTTAGAIPETVPAGAGVLVPPDDVAALTAALRRLIESPEVRARLAAGARAARLPSWQEQAAASRRVLEGRRMSGFSAEWLTLRERYDPPRATPTVLDAVAHAFVDRAAITIVDLASGTGSTLRAIGRICRGGRSGGWSITISVCSRRLGAEISRTGT